MWYYQYDALGRRISKACPQQQLRITYLWDGDQLAYTQTVKQNKLVSQRHSVFNGWQLIAQQDCYQQSQQTLDGNKTEWKHETHYAITQPNGKVLGLLSPEGKLKWKDEKRSVWGLLFPNDYRKTSPLDPQQVFAGQWFDEESGLAYNRFRYYDPESGNYISSDPIGLNGGETPYSYTHNPIGWVDPFGLSSCQLSKAMENAGIVRPKHSAAHHIVPETAAGAEPARKILKKHDIDINSEFNGVFLPSRANIDNLPGILHNGRHPNRYINEINKRIIAADKLGGKQGVIDELISIRERLGNAPRSADWRTVLL
ncbi:RHS repeat-associated core domain-containing protein [Pasteurella sp. PK-2025]|uniref:RHS repeat-associated core domain-containing protein n=1 Tax=Pasteurella sp. PK-2025 TaxID=3413133 RepID=UPI003C7961A0